ncbi:hypothetical protein QBC46DRAFT_447417 [Diplogelasinospora grovesii]|uniref:Uncharacterized protein n=1 Tax=Diplogelasinospora grovesii TaxID=303347 RepID=A0AAN6NCD7_9PEZI|nr:hypothetical protein QBC46DRAFT_447417 [Diplogelasinospora grovesii]
MWGERSASLARDLAFSRLTESMRYLSLTARRVSIGVIDVDSQTDLLRCGLSEEKPTTGGSKRTKCSVVGPHICMGYTSCSSDFRNGSTQQKLHRGYHLRAAKSTLSATAQSRDFKRQLDKICTSDGSLRQHPDVSPEAHDIFVRSLEAVRANFNGKLPPYISPVTTPELQPHSPLIQLFTRCVTSSILDFVTAADDFMRDLCGVSLLQDPLLVQVLVALAIKHRNLALLSQALHLSRPPPPEHNIFSSINPNQSSGTFSLGLRDGYYTNEVWSHLSSAGWVQPFPTDAPTPPSVPPQPVQEGVAPDAGPGFHIVQSTIDLHKTNPQKALAELNQLFYGHWVRWDPRPFTGEILRVLVEHGTATMVLMFLPLVLREVYDGIPPHPRWPGEDFLVTTAAARPD